MAEQHDPVSDFIEAMGLLWEGEGVPRIAGRIFGLVATSASPCSLDDMMHALGVSKASISTDARRLEQLGLVERVALPGDRRDYYTISPEAPARIIARRLETTRRFQAAFKRLRGAEVPPEAAARLRAFDLMNDRIVAALTAVLHDLGDGSGETRPAPRPYLNS